jgi:hypothetical protein
MENPVQPSVCRSGQTSVSRAPRGRIRPRPVDQQITQGLSSLASANESVRTPVLSAPFANPGSVSDTVSKQRDDAPVGNGPEPPVVG